MTESEWGTSSDPGAMLHWITQSGEVRTPTMEALHRKLRLFACGCCRQAWDGARCERCYGCGRVRPAYLEDEELDEHCPDCHGSGRIGGLTDPRSRRAVEVAERYADGDVNLSHIGLLTARRQAEVETGWVWCATCPDIAVGLRQIVYWNNRPHEYNFGPTVPPALQASILRDVFGNPFRDRRIVDDQWAVDHAKIMGHVGMHRSWLAWNDGCVRKLAQAIYDEREFGRMPLLADALEEAGCEDAAILSHCRGSGPHVRGCFVLDLLLGKE